MRRNAAPPLVLWLATVAGLAAQGDPGPRPVRFVVPADRGPGPVILEVRDGDLPLGGALRREDGVVIACRTEGDPVGDRRVLTWFEPKSLSAGVHRFTCVATDAPAAFAVVGTDAHRTLLRDDRPVLRFEHAYDPERRELTYKPFHHVIAAVDGLPITKGPGGQYSHHRGLFLGWSRTRIGDGPAHDFWHCNHGETLRCDSHAVEETTPVRATTLDQVHWETPDGAVALRELRRTTAWRSDHLAVVDFHITLSAPDDRPVTLDGDPQHAGFQFRAADEVHDHQELTVYERPATAAGGQNDVWRDLSWCRLITPIRAHRYAILHLNHPDNGDGWVYSTRAYGRFGAYKPLRIDAGAQRSLRFRILVEDLGPRDADTAPTIDAEAAFAAFVHMTVEPVRG